MCWPLTAAEVTLAIPCNASKPFVEMVIKSKPSFDVANIPGKKANALYIFTYSKGVLSKHLSLENRTRKVFFDT